MLSPLALALLFVGASAAHFPVHSWATVPAFIHTSVLNDAVLCAADLVVFARFSAITIEKWQGCNATPGCYHPNNAASPSSSVVCASQEAATLAAAAQIKAASPNASVFTWTDSLRVYSRRSINPDIRDVEWQSCVRNELAEYVEANPELALRNASGGLALESYLHAHVYDHTNSRMAALWQEACLNATASGLLDGCGADAGSQTGSYILGLDPAKSAAWTAAHIATMESTTAAMSALGGVVLGKVLAQLGSSTNGVLQEGCGASNTTINTLRAASAAATAASTRYLFECHSNGSVDELAAFLCGAGVDHYWGFGGWVYQR